MVGRGSGRPLSVGFASQQVPSGGHRDLGRRKRQSRYFRRKGRGPGKHLPRQSGCRNQRPGGDRLLDPGQRAQHALAGLQI